ncbi:MAG TPA: hypothetical protein VFP34_19700 [Microlunatus sp.]|nr:hypothetical protein [Microlunatus sp.]
MSTQRLQQTETRPITERDDVHQAGSTTATSAQDTPSRRRHARPVLLAAAALAALAVVALTFWLIATGSHTQTAPTTPPVAAAPQHKPPALTQSNGAGNTANIHGPRAYILHCENSPSLCAPPALKPTNSNDLQFCENSPTLCEARKPN